MRVRHRRPTPDGLSTAPGFLRRHSLSVTLAVILAAMMATTFGLGLPYYQAYETGGQPFTWPGFLLWWCEETVLSLEADVFGALVLVTGTKWLFEHRSMEAADPPEEHGADKETR